MKANIGKDTVELDGSEIVVTIDGIEHRAGGFGAGMCSGEVDQLKAALSFLSACAESYAHAMRKRENPFAVDASGQALDPDSHVWLFPKEIVEWAYKNDVELSMCECELEEMDED